MDTAHQALYNFARENGAESWGDSGYEKGYQSWKASSGGGKSDKERAKEAVTRNYTALTSDQVLSAVDALLGSGSMATQEAVMSYITAAYGVPPEESYQAVSEVLSREMETPETKYFTAPISLFKERKDIYAESNEYMRAVSENYPDLAQKARADVIESTGATDPDEINLLALAQVIDQKGELKFSGEAPYTGTEPYPTRRGIMGMPIPVYVPESEKAKYVTPGVEPITINKDIVDELGARLKANKAQIYAGIDAPINNVGGSERDKNYIFRGFTEGYAKTDTSLATPAEPTTPVSGSWEDLAFRTLMSDAEKAMSEGRSEGYVTLPEPLILDFFEKAQSYQKIAQHTDFNQLANVVRGMPREDIQLVNDIGSSVLGWQMGANPVGVQAMLTANNQNIGDLLDTAYSQSLTYRGSGAMAQIERGGYQGGQAGYYGGKSLNEWAIGQAKRGGQLPADVLQTTAFSQQMSDELKGWIPKVMADALGTNDILNFFPGVGGAGYKGKETPPVATPPPNFFRQVSGYQPINYQKPRW